MKIIYNFNNYNIIDGINNPYDFYNDYDNDNDNDNDNNSKNPNEKDDLFNEYSKNP